MYFCFKDAQFNFTSQNKWSIITFIYQKSTGRKNQQHKKSKNNPLHWNFYPRFSINETKASRLENGLDKTTYEKAHSLLCLSANPSDFTTLERRVRGPSARLALNKRIGTFLKSDDRGKFNNQTGCLESILLSLSTNLMYSSFSV